MSDIQFCRIALFEALQRSAFLRTFGGCLPFPHPPPPPPPPPPPTTPSPPPPAFPLHAVLPVVQCQHQLINFAAADRCFSRKEKNFSPIFPR